MLHLMLLLAMPPSALAQPSFELQQQALACGSDIACIQSVVEAMQAQFGAAGQAQPAEPHGDGPCRACRARVTQLKQYGSVAGYACRPLDVDLTWEFHQQEERTPASRIGPPTSVRMTMSERYPACAMIISQPGGSGDWSRIEVTGPESADAASADIVAAQATYGLVRPSQGLLPSGDTFGSISSDATSAYAVDLERREFGWDHVCSSDTQGTGQLQMPSIRVAVERIVPPGNWDILVGALLGKDQRVDLGAALTCDELLAAATQGRVIEHTVPFQQESASVTPPGTGAKLSTFERIDGTVKVTITGVSAGAPAGSGPELAVTPSAPFTAKRSTRKTPFQPRTRTYTLTNVGEAPLSFRIDTDVAWASVQAASGMLDPKETRTVTASLNKQADLLDETDHGGQMRFLNLTGGKGSTARSIKLSTGQNWRYSYYGYAYHGIEGGTIDGGMIVFWRTDVDFTIRSGKYQGGSGRSYLVKTQPFSQPQGLFDCELANGSYIDKGGKNHATPHITQTHFSVSGHASKDHVTLHFPKEPNEYHIHARCLLDPDELKALGFNPWKSTPGKAHPFFGTMRLTGSRTYPLEERVLYESGVKGKAKSYEAVEMKRLN